LSQAASMQGAITRDRKAAQIEKFRALVDARLRTHHSVESYAGALGITASQLGRLSRDVIGLSPLEFINARLVREAQRDLAYTGLSVKQIALGLGFNDSAYFTRFFNKQTGLSPTEFREAAQKAMLSPA
jgi:AraC family transcriptional activator of pobA